MVQNVYGNATDLANARASLGTGYNYVDTSVQGYKPGNYTSNDLVVGGTGATGGVYDSGNAIRLAGVNRDETLNAIKGYASNQALQQAQQQAMQQPQQQALQAPQQQTMQTPSYVQSTYTPQVPQQINIPIYDPTNDIKGLATAQKAAALAGLSSAHDQNLSDLNTANGKIEPAYYKQRNAASTDNQVAARNFAEYLNQRGSTNSGTADQSSIASNLSLQGNLGSLAAGEAGAYADNAKQVGDTNVKYNNDITSSNANIDATNTQQLIAAQQAYNAAKLAQANTDRGYNYQVGRDNVTDANTNKALDYQISRDTVTDTGKTANGTSTIAGLQSAASIAASNASTIGQLIQNQYAPQIAQGSIDAQKATTAYQTMVNNNYPQEEALKIAGVVSQNAGLILDNNAKSIANQYAPQIAQGSIDGQKLTNAYQSLVNNGYPAAQAADIALKYANIRQGDTQNAIAQQNANTNASSAASDAAYKQASLAAAKASAASKASNGGLTVAQQTAANKAATEAQINAAQEFMSKSVITNNNSNEKALSTLTGSKGGWIDGLVKAGMSPKDALSYYTQMYSSLKTSLKTN